MLLSAITGLCFPNPIPIGSHLSACLSEINPSLSLSLSLSPVERENLPHGFPYCPINAFIYFPILILWSCFTYLLGFNSSPFTINCTYGHLHLPRLVCHLLWFSFSVDKTNCFFPRPVCWGLGCV
jgi:hypothetical protein